MTSDSLASLVKVGLLKAEPGDQAEFDGLLRAGRAKFKDAANEDLEPESRFDLAYNAAHALSLAALRWHGYRPDKRYVVFQALQHTLAMPAGVWRVLDRCHSLRNAAEYEGEAEIDTSVLDDLMKAVGAVRDAVLTLGPIR